MTQLFQSAIQRIIPHRYPFLLVDRVTDFVPAARIEGIKTFTANGSATEGNAPGISMVPAGILIEMVTQLGAILVLERPQMADKAAVILAIPSAQMLKPVEIGDTLRVTAEVVKLKENFGELRGAAFREGEKVAEGQMRFAIVNTRDLLAGHAVR